MNELYGSYSAVIKKQNGDSVDCVFENEMLPGIISIPIFVGVPGVKVELEMGTRVIVQFMNGDLKSPFVLAYAHGVKAKNITISASDTIENNADKSVIVDGGTEIKLGKDAQYQIGTVMDTINAPAGTAGGPCTFLNKMSNTKIKV